jgi:hypothetical protein
MNLIRALLRTLRFNQPGNNRKSSFQGDDKAAVVAKHLQVKYTTRLVLHQPKIIEWWKRKVELSSKGREVSKQDVL